MTRARSSRRKKASWAAFFLVALSISVPAVILPTVNAAETPQQSNGERDSSKDAFDQSTEATNAYNLALQTLHSISSLPSSSSAHTYTSSPNTFLSTLFPNTQGPIASTIRIIYKLQSSFSRILGFGLGGFTGGEGKKEEIRGKALKVLDLLEYAAELGHLDALFKLGQLSLSPPPALPLNATKAYLAFSHHASLTGNATSQAAIAFFHATGYGDIVPVNQAKAQLYYTFAAQSGDPGSEMVLAYRNWAGIGVNEDCMSALGWYELAAERAMSHFLSGPPGGLTLPQTPIRLSDLDGGVYGPGSSVASTGLNANRPVVRAGNAMRGGERWEDLVEFYQFHADRDEFEYAYRLGKIFYQGSLYSSPGGIASGSEGVSSLPRDFVKSRSYFMRVARQVWPPTSSLPPSPTAHLTRKEGVTDENILLTASSAAGYIGRMFLRGEGVRQDARVAKMWFERGAEFSERECLNGLGIIYRDGLVKAEGEKEGKKDVTVANGYFGAAAGQDLAESQVNLGKYHYHRGELSVATTYFETAIRHGSPFEAYYYIALMHSSQALNPSSPSSVVTGSCGIAVSFFKMVAERGSWKTDLLEGAYKMWVEGDEKDREGAKIRWWIAAERGVEVAQNNLAYVLDQDRTSFRSLLPSPSNKTALLALTQYTRSAAQRNIDALVKVGDYYYHGLGVNDEPEKLRWEKAAGYYQSAVDSQMSALAMWNLGWMYENGVGVVKDFHLAKRYYDMAFQTNREAYIPVLLSLTKLYARSLWHTLSGGKEKSLTLWADDSEEDHWYLGKAKEEFKKRWRGKKSDQRSELGSGRDGAENKDGEAQPTAGGGQQQRPVPDDDDPIQWAQNRRQEESRVDDEGAYIPGDYFSGDGYGGGGGRGATPEEEDVDEFWETVFLLGLCLAISGLVYLRGRWMTEQARRQAAEAERANGGGNPPAPPPEPPLQQVPRGVGGDVLPDIGLLRQDQVDGTDGL